MEKIGKKKKILKLRNRRRPKRRACGWHEFDSETVTSRIQRCPVWARGTCHGASLQVEAERAADRLGMGDRGGRFFRKSLPLN